MRGAGEHLAELRLRGLRATTIEQRQRVLRRLARHSGVDPADATTEQVRAFLERIPTPSSRATELSHLRQFYRWAVIAGVCATDPTLPIPRPRVPRRLPRPMPESDIVVALASAPERVYPWLLLAGWAGLRACEIARLRADDVWTTTEPPMLSIGEGKGGGQSMVPLSDFLALELAELGLPSRGWLFPRRDGRPGPTPPHIVSQLSNRHLRAVGVGHTLHSLRHRFGTEAYRQSRDLRLVQELMRHASPVSTAGYTRVVAVEGAGIVNRLPAPQREEGGRHARTAVRVQ
jgi:integrase